MLSVAELIPWRSSHTTLSLLLSLDARTAAAAAAADLSSSPTPLGGSKPDERLDPGFHCREAEAAVRTFAFPPLPPPGGAPLGEAVHADPAVTAEVYLQLMAVQDAAGLPLEAVRVALQVMAGELPLQSEVATAVLEGAAAAGGVQGIAAGAAAAGGVQGIAAGAMRLANGAGAYRATVLLFLEALSRGGGVVSDGAVIELVSALGWAGGLSQPR